ncbi:hypothetical protein [Geodermatophilus sp. URMC 64]
MTRPLLSRPLIGPVFTGQPIPREQANTSIVFVQPRRSEAAETVDTADEAPAATEAAPATTCSACENFGEALARIEDLLGSLLLDVENLRVRMDTALGVLGD